MLKVVFQKVFTLQEVGNAIRIEKQVEKKLQHCVYKWVVISVESHDELAKTKKQYMIYSQINGELNN